MVKKGERGLRRKRTHSAVAAMITTQTTIAMAPTQGPTLGSFI